MFPEIEGQDFQDLVDDIKKNGLRHDIILLDGMVLDGRNRLLACEAAGVKPKFDEYIGDNPLDFVVTENLSRRHLTDSQRAMIAAEIATAKRGNYSKSADSGISAADAAARMKVSTRSVETARRIKRGSSSLASKVKRGEMSLHAAETRLHPPTPLPNSVLPPEPVRPEKPAAQQPNKLTPERFQKVLEELEGMIPDDCDHTKFAIIANKFVERQMNFGRNKNESSAYLR